jgi:hypothetical protein
VKRWLQNFSIGLVLGLSLGCVFSADAASTLINLAKQVIGILPAANGGTGVNSTATFPSSGTVMITTTAVACSQLPALTGNVTTSAGNCATTIASSAVTNAMLASVSYTKTVISGFCTGAASTSLAISLAHLGATATTCTTTSTTNAGWVAPNSGTVKNLYVQEVTTQKSGTTMAWTAQKCTAGSCSAQTVTCTVANAGTACNDTTHSFTVAAGDIVQIKSGTTASASETMANVSVSMELWN